MKKIILMMLVMGPAQAWAGQNNSKLGLDYLTGGSQDQTPYQKIEGLFNQATPMQLSKFLNSGDLAIKKWNCVGAGVDTTASQLSPMDRAPVHEVVITTENPIAGLLFPGTQLQQDVIMLEPNDGNGYEDPGLLAAYIREHQVQLIARSPGVIQSVLGDENDPKSKATLEFKTTEGLIVVHQTVEADSDRPELAQYFYCYEQ